MASSTVEFQCSNLTVFSDGSIHRAPFEPPPVPPCPFPSSPHQVASKDLIINTPHAISARLFLPPRVGAHAAKLPILLYFYGGAFFTGSTTLPPYHHFLCKLACHANVLIVSIDYRLLPEHPLPAAYEDGFQGLMWVEEQAKLGMSGESWLASYGDFERCFLGGDSGGATIVHFVAMQAAGYKPWDAGADADTSSNLKSHVCVQGMILIHPFFTCGRGASVPSSIELGFLKYSKIKYTDDALADPFSPAAPPLANARLPRALVFIAGLDNFRNRGILYHQNLVDAGKDATMVLHENEQHGFQVHTPESPNVIPLLDMVRNFVHEK